MKPLFNNILIKPEKQEEKTAGGIYIPDTVREKPVYGIVVEVSDEVKDIKKGDKVLYKKWGANSCTFQGEEMVILDRTELIAIL